MATHQQRPTQPSAGPGPGGGAGGPPGLPEIDLTQFSEEERRQIQAVLDRQRQEEEKEARLIRYEIYVVVYFYYK